MHHNFMMDKDTKLILSEVFNGNQRYVKYVMLS